ncbi:MAG: DUF2382 domain-containing protein [Pseudonocardiaceae bacterium]|nr:MAG: DUF2382 domain-containing protein [Pseudonocardiaceae bacterium]
MITEEMTRDLIGRQAYDQHGEKVGKIGQVYVDDRNGAPTWATVNTGLFGMKESFVPLDNADVKGGDVALGVEKAQVKDAPHVGETADRLDAREEEALRRHYGHWDPSTAAHGDGRRDAGGRGEAMTRSEERMRVDTEAEEVGTVRLRKYVVTEEQQVTVPVRHEEVRVEREPIADGGSRTGRSTLGEETQEVTLHAEKPVVSTTTEEVERVRLGTRTVTEDETVAGKVRKEQIDVDDPQHHLPSADRRRES